MTRTSFTTRIILAIAALSVVVLSSGVGSSLGADATVDFPAGLACSGFDLRIEITNSANRVERQFTDKDGNVVRVLSAGKGSALTFINLASGASLALQANGSVQQTTLNSDGTSTTAVTGHSIIILFPTDVPAGPSTTLYVGRVGFTVDTNGVFTLQQVSGATTDICAALST